MHPRDDEEYIDLVQNRPEEIKRRYDEKSFLESLQTYKSEELKKARRNLSVIAFSVISAWALQIKLSELKVFGIDLSNSSELGIFLIGLLLVGYWTLMFGLAWRHDLEIQKERTITLNATISAFVKRWAEIEKTQAQRRKEGKMVSFPGFTPPDYAEVRMAVELYERQQARTLKASSLARIIKNMELYVPSVLATVCIVILLAGIAHAL